MTEILESKNYNYKSEQKIISAKGKLKENINFDTTIANETILQITEEGYILSLTETPSEAKLSNTKSVLRNSVFAQETIEDMLLPGITK